MIGFSNAKINLGLYVTHKREDGFHDIVTVFLPIPLYDAIEVLPATKFSIHVHGPVQVSEGEDNLIVKAYRLLSERYKFPPYRIDLLKTIPTGAGLGGGSANASKALQLFNEIGRLNLGDDELSELALNLGSDCPFFILNRPAHAQGRGEILTPISLELPKQTWMVLVLPGLHVSTKEAFENIKISNSEGSLLNKISSPTSGWKANIQNAFEETVFKRFPILSSYKTALYNENAWYASMSGSGSTIYGFFRSKGEAVKACKVIGRSFTRVLLLA